MYTQAISCLINQACNNNHVDLLSDTLGVDLRVFIGYLDNCIIFYLLVINSIIYCI